MFTGLIYCADCGFKMRNHVERFTYKDGRPGRYSAFICGSYSRSGKTACTIHTIYENALSEIVLNDIRAKAAHVKCNKTRLIEQIICLKDKEAHSRLMSYEQEVTALRKRITELEKLMQSLYEDKCKGTVPSSVFTTLIQKYETERAEKVAVLPELETKLRTQLESRQNADHWAGVIEQYTDLTRLDETILFELVDRIEVGETKKRGNLRICDVRIYYRYVGNVDDAFQKQEADK